jgi:hypothetical protein
MKHLNRCLLIALLFLVTTQNRTFGQTFQVDTILYQGDVDYPINLVMLGDGFLENELQVFRDSAEAYLNDLFTIEPYSRFKSFFNAFSISVPSNESGAAMDPSNLIDNYFGSTYGYAGIDRLLVPTNNSHLSSVLANNFPEYDQVFMLVNSIKYGGSGGWVATASLNVDSKEIALHEMGHSFAGLADEYWAGDQYAREATNMTQETNLDILRWRNWYGDNDIGLYPHAESPSWYRPHQNCIMRYLGEPFCAVCREGVIETIYSLASPFKGYEPGITTFQMNSDSIVFKLNLNHPEPNTLETTWLLNGTMIGEGVDSVSVLFSDLNAGSNSVIASVIDTSSLSRPYEDETYHQIEVEWVVSSGPLGTEDVEIIKRYAISLYPNPAYHYVNLQLLGEGKGEAHIQLYDLKGSEVQSYILTFPGSHSLDLNGLEAGIYLVKISLDGNYLSSRRIIKQ